MVSALRQRAARQSASGSPPVLGDDVAFTTPLRAGRPRPRRRVRWPRWLDGRRVGLGVSILAAMAASAIGGGLLVNARPAPASAVALPWPAASAAAAASAASHPLAKAASAPVAHAPAAPASTALAASAAASAAASSPPAMPPAPAPMADLTFGLDLNGDGLPDSLERFVRKTMPAPATRVAARQYYRLALPLATRAQQGEVLPHNEKQALFRATECYWLSAADDGLADPPNLNDRAMLMGTAAALRMQALAESLQGFDYRVGDGKRHACG